MKVSVPQCPSCKKKHTLIFVDTNRENPPRSRCTEDAGGCGMYYYLEDLPRLYVEEERQ